MQGKNDCTQCPCKYTCQETDYMHPCNMHPAIKTSSWMWPEKLEMRQRLRFGFLLYKPIFFFYCINQIGLFKFYHTVFWATCYSVDIYVRNCLSKCCMFWQDHKQIPSPQRFRGLCSPINCWRKATIWQDSSMLCELHSGNYAAYWELFIKGKGKKKDRSC